MFVFRQLLASNHLEQVIDLELQSYPPDESASPERVTYRLINAPHLQFGCFLAEDLIGIILATATRSTSITAESMAIHDPNGTTLCIHSVCVKKDWQRQGIATKMLEAYLDRFRNSRMMTGGSSASDKEDQEKGGWKLDTASIIVHQHLVSLYAKLGFIVTGQSSIQHGKDPWLEMNIDL